jgi:NAD(P)-dependent dehydrogenase (short-subunit alcohol dehydrogenase family)
MARIFITGSADGLGHLAAVSLISQGHQVVLHARNEKRGQDALAKAPGAEGVVTADLSSIEETKELASKVNDLGSFDAIIHNAASYQDPGEKILAVNTLAPYVLTCLIERPERLIYMSSGMHKGGHARLDSFRDDQGSITYSDSKLHVLMLAKALARHWPDVYANALDPGWVPTKMGGPNAPDDLQEGYETQVWLATNDDEAVKVSGRYFHHKKEATYSVETDDTDLQERFLLLCEELTLVPFTSPK